MLPWVIARILQALELYLDLKQYFPVEKQLLLYHYETYFQVAEVKHC